MPRGADALYPCSTLNHTLIIPRLASLAVCGYTGGMRRNTTGDLIQRFMRELGAAVRSEGSVYFTGGVSAVLLGWREMTLDVTAMITDGLVVPAVLATLVAEVRTEMLRYPAIDADLLVQHVNAIAASGLWA